MRSFDPQLAEIRFGYGLSPDIAAPRDATQILDGLAAPDDMAARYPTEPFRTFLDRSVAAQATRVMERKNRGTPQEKQARQERQQLNRDARKAWIGWVGQNLWRRSFTDTAFRERLVAFWADHFTARGKVGVFRRATTPYIDDAIRPAITLRFADLLQSAVMHPVMLDYLDQARSMGPNSRVAKRRAGRKPSGMNENLAREVLELHTLGVGAPYTQTDVTELAKLFTGMTYQAKKGYYFRAGFVEPGAERVLGQTYADAWDDGSVRAALEDLAMHRSTARHIAWKLAVHFTSDDPEAALVDALEATYLAHDGALMPVYATLLDHPASWQPQLVNAKPPIDFVSSAIRALSPAQDVAGAATPKQFIKFILRPLAQMGQAWEQPIGPDGWSENDADWITPQGIAARVTWAMQVPRHVRNPLPDPRVFVETTLGGFADEPVRFAAAAAESKPEAIGIVLMSPAFQRR
ncbi:DUF1800 domain-containing protein [uncultured Tateyamaria sp.]|uniref:DUF1800 domain-containing protein n=1 Tax=uncultured Tateyamaria sp. TaxID=455651 RepID=UPI00260533B6|nr:DUF1800 domain-containing protein [uncultured Tateyamaria sp.]